MTYVGIDIVRLKLFAVEISSNKMFIELFKFTNAVDGFQLLVSKFDFFNKNNIIIDLKVTLHYSVKLPC